MFICLYVYMFKRVRVDISMVVICYDSDFTEYDGRASELSNAAPHIKQHNTSTEKDYP